MTHENFIYVIMMTITEVNREVKQGKQEEFNKLVQKQKKKEEKYFTEMKLDFVLPIKNEKHGQKSEKHQLSV